MKLTTIIINHNTRALLQACLQSVFSQTKNIDFEAIVVDNGSTDGSREMLVQDFPQVVTIFNDENKGFAAANNQGIRQAQGEYVLLLNSDTEILNHAIGKTIAFMDHHPDASIAGCKLLNPDGTLQPSCRSFPSAWNLFAEATFLYLLFKKTKLFGGYHKTDFDYAETRQVDVVMGAFMMIRREVFENAGLLDESYFMYTEETDFCYRARQFGFKVYFTPEAQIIHHVAASKKSLYSFHKQLHLSQLLFIRKHFTGIRKALCVFWKRFGLALRVPVYALAGLLRIDRNWLQKALIYAKVLRKSFHINTNLTDQNSKPRVLLVNFSSRGGLAHHVYFLCDALAKIGVDFILLTTRKFELSEQCIHFQCEKKLFSHIKYKSMLLKGLVYCASLFMVFLNVRRLKPRILHLQEIRIPFIEKWLLRYARRQGVKIIFTAHDIVNTDLEHISDSNGLNKVYQWFDSVVAHTESIKQTIASEFDIPLKKITVLPVGEYTMLPSGQLEQPAARKILGIAENRKVALFFGYIRRYKGLNLLLDALAKTKEKMPEIFLIIAGEPKEEMREYYDFLEKYELSKFVFLDIRYIPMEKMSIYFSASDVVVMPYLRVFQSGLVRLAFAHKCPVIATDVGDLSLTVEHGKTGFLIQPNSVQALTEAMQQAFSDQARLHEMGEAGYQMMRERFSWQNIANEMKKLYDLILQ